MQSYIENRFHVPTENRAIQALRALQGQLAPSGLPKTTTRLRQADYRLEPEQVTPSLQVELDQFWQWMIAPESEFEDLQNAVCTEVAAGRLGNVHRFFGWLVRYKQIPVTALSLSQLVGFTPIKTAYEAATSFEEQQQVERQAKSAAELTLVQLREYLQWLRTERQVNPRSEQLVVDVVVEIAQFLYRRETDRFKGKTYSDVPTLVLLKQLRQKVKLAAKDAPTVADTSLKWLDWDDFVRFVQQLESECSPQYNAQKQRSLSAVARSVRRYLICAFLCYMPPDRQRTLRELEVGRTLLKGHFRKDGFLQESADGHWYIWLGKGDYKTAKTYGESMSQVPELMVPYLEDWLGRLRGVFQPTHQLVFTQTNGKPFTKASTLSAIIRQASHRLTGQLLHSHLIRHMLVTHAKRLKVDAESMKSLALAMHQSVETQGRDYDDRSLLERVQPAQALVMALAQGKRPGFHPEDLSVEELSALIRQLPMQSFERLMVMLGR